MKTKTTHYPEVIIHSNGNVELTKEQVQGVVDSLTPASRKMFDDFIGEAEDWNGQPCLGELTPQEKGNLGDLVKKGLVTVEHDKYDKVDWIVFPNVVLEHFEIEF